MQITVPPPLPQPVRPQVANSTVQVSLQPSVVASLATTQTTATQTVQAPQAAGRSDSARYSQSRGDSAKGKDALAQSVDQRANRTAAGGSRQRGGLVDVRV